MKEKYLTLPEGAALAILALGLVLWLFWPKAAAGTVVEVTGRDAGAYPLNVPARIEVTGEHGLTLTLVIEDGAAHVEEPRCPDRLCEGHAPISRTGESIICLPAQVVITVKGGSVDGPDAVTG